MCEDIESAGGQNTHATLGVVWVTWVPDGKKCERKIQRFKISAPVANHPATLLADAAHLAQISL